MCDSFLTRLRRHVSTRCSGNGVGTDGDPPQNARSWRSSFSLSSSRINSLGLLVGSRHKISFSTCTILNVSSSLDHLQPSPEWQLVPSRLNTRHKTARWDALVQSSALRKKARRFIASLKTKWSHPSKPL